MSKKEWKKCPWCGRKYPKNEFNEHKYQCGPYPEGKDVKIKHCEVCDRETPHTVEHKDPPNEDLKCKICGNHQIAHYPRRRKRGGF